MIVNKKIELQVKLHVTCTTHKTIMSNIRIIQEDLLSSSLRVDTQVCKVNNEDCRYEVIAK